MTGLSTRAVPQPAEQALYCEINSPLLFGVLHSVAPESRIEVLDLAPANKGLLDYFAAYHCRLNLPGCRDELLALTVQEDDTPEVWSERIRKLHILEARTPHTLDLILLWDLPDYLDQQRLMALIDYLEPHVTPRTVLHFYIHTRSSMSARPADYTFNSSHTVSISQTSGQQISSPRLYQELLHKLLAPFKVERGMLLANGLQEFILRCGH